MPQFDLAAILAALLPPGTPIQIDVDIDLLPDFGLGLGSVGFTS